MTTPYPIREASIFSFRRGLVGWALFVGVAIMLFVLLRQQSGPAYDLSLSEFATEYGNYNVKSVLVEGDEIHGEFITAPKHSNGLLRFRTILPQGTGGQWEFM